MPWHLTIQAYLYLSSSTVLVDSSPNPVLSCCPPILLLSESCLSHPNPWPRVEASSEGTTPCGTPLPLWPSAVPAACHTCPRLLLVISHSVICCTVICCQHSAPVVDVVSGSAELSRLPALPV